MRFVTLITMFCFVFFLDFAIIRPHRKKQKRFASTQESIGEGSVVYAAGIRGIVSDVRRDSMVIVSGPRRTPLEIDRSAVEAVENPRP